MKTTFDDYLKAVKLQVEVKKKEDYGIYFLMPSPAKLRELCLVFFDQKLNSHDEAVFKIFFKPKDGQSLRNAIEKLDVDKFRPIVNFFKEKNERTNFATLDLIAVLVDYKPRPYHHFIKQKPFVEEITAAPLAQESSDTPLLKEEKEEFTSSETSEKRNRNVPRYVFFILLFISFLGMSYVAKDICFPAKECMQWQEDRYVVVDCKSESIGLLMTLEKKPLQKELLDLRKIEVTTATKLFEYDKPLVWYCKQNKKVEFFNQPGLHPVTGKTLKPITPYIATKYGKSN